MTTEPYGEHRTIVMPRRRTTTRIDASVAAGVPRLGSVLGRYRLCLELASGGMSTVYLARVHDGLGLHRFAALKCLRPQLASDPELVEMFLDEGRIASWIQHPNVCAVLDCHHDDGVTFLAMEYLRGQSVAAIRRALVADAEEMAPAQLAAVVVRIVTDAAEGLHAAHELTTPSGEPMCVVHRDISPENLFVTYDGNVKVMDFGIAATAQQRHHTQPGTMKGKYAYISPEVLAGQKPSRRADVWSLGVVTWEMLTGRRLFYGVSDVDVLRSVTDAAIPRPSEIRTGLPRDLDDVVLRALERDPARRYPTAREFGRKLTCLLAEQRLAVGLADLAELMDRLFPNGRACARQLLDTVEKMGDGSGPFGLDHEDRPTVLVSESPVRARGSDQIQIPPVPPGAVTPLPAPAPPVPAPAAAAPMPRWAWPIASIAAAIVIVATSFALRGCVQASGAAPPPQQPQSKPVTLDPVQLPTGEVVYRLRSD